MKYSGNGTLQKFSGETIPATYTIEYPGSGNIGNINPQQSGVETTEFANQEIALHLEFGRMLTVTIDANLQVIYNNGQAIGFE